jgi:hypothetical protein
MGLGSGIRDPGSGKNLFRIPDPGVKKAPDPGSGSATLEKSATYYSSSHMFLGLPDPNPDPLVKDTDPGSGSFYYQAKIVRKH